MIVRLAALAFLMLTGGCTLSSRTPLIEQSERVSGLGDGRYQLYIALLPEDAAKLGDAERKRCLDPGYRGEGNDTPGAPVERKHIVYCDRDPGTNEDAPVIKLRWAGDRYQVEGPEGAATMRFRGDAAGLYLLQTDETSKANHYDYWFARPHSAALEMFMLACTEFPSIAKRDEDGVSSCEIASLATVQSELGAYAAGIGEGRKVPIAILKPIP